MKKTPQIISRLDDILAELQRLPLPAGRQGAQLLDALEVADTLRAKLRSQAKAFLRRAPDALPGWTIGRVIGRDGKEKAAGSLMTICEHTRAAATRLIKQRPAPHPREMELDL